MRTTISSVERADLASPFENAAIAFRRSSAISTLSEPKPRGSTVARLSRATRSSSESPFRTKTLQRERRDKREKSVLLRLVEPVDFIDENYRSSAECARLVGAGHHLLDFLDAARHGGKRDELRLGSVGYDVRKRRLADAGWPPEHHRRNRIRRNHAPQDAALADKMPLADDIVERCRPQPFGERRRAARARVLEEGLAAALHLASWAECTVICGNGISTPALSNSSLTLLRVSERTLQ